MLEEMRDTPSGAVAIVFARALVAGKYKVAHEMLSASLQETISIEQLKETFETMIEYGDSLPNYVDVDAVMDNWPGKQEADIGWAYASIAGDHYAEAVTVIVTQEQTKQVIREIEWGRP